MDEVREIQQALAAPFPAEAVGWKPQSVNKEQTRCMVCAYIDARDVMDRLDEVLGIDGWADDYEVLPTGSVVCSLYVRLGAEWVHRQDVGSPSDQPDAGDKLKAAFSDALKRAAVHVGIGRYLYRLPTQWVAYDAKRKCPAAAPQLPAWALPAPAQAAPAPAPAPKAEAPPAKAPRKTLSQRLREKDAELAAERLCRPGELVAFVVDAGGKSQFPKQLDAWAGDQVTVCGGWVGEFEKAKRREAQRRAEKVSEEQAHELAELLGRKRRHLRAVAKAVGVKSNAVLDDLTQAEYGRLKAFLEAVPDPEEAEVG